MDQLIARGQRRLDALPSHAQPTAQRGEPSGPVEPECAHGRPGKPCLLRFGEQKVLMLLHPAEFEQIIADHCDPVLPGARRLVDFRISFGASCNLQ